MLASIKFKDRFNYSQKSNANKTGVEKRVVKQKVLKPKANRLW